MSPLSAAAAHPPPPPTVPSGAPTGRGCPSPPQGLGRPGLGSRVQGPRLSHSLPLCPAGNDEVTSQTTLGVELC